MGKISRPLKKYAMTLVRKDYAIEDLKAVMIAAKWRKKGYYVRVTHFRPFLHAIPRHCISVYAKEPSRRGY